ncbi:MAG: alpha/beta hydrolase, partial [Litoreibacter sp.]
DAMCKKFWVAHPESIKTQDFEMDGIPVRVYTPENAGKRAILFTHGGGFVLGSLDSHDDVCAELAAATGTEVWASHYRLSPEHIYPAALDDVEAVWRRLTLDRREAVVVGDSAGARLSAALCLRMRRLDGPMPIAQILIYPTLGGSATLPSFIENANAPMLTAADMNNFDVLYKGDYQDGKDPELSPLQAQEFSGLPPAYVVTADIDPLRDEGSTYVDKLRKAGVKAQWKNEPQLVHGYLRARHSSQRAHDSFSGIVEKLQTFLV